MHAKEIIQDLLDEECPGIHAKRRHCLAAMVDACRRGGLVMMGMSRVLGSKTTLRHRIKRCDRLLSNTKLGHERPSIYAAMVRRILSFLPEPAIIVDWSDLLPDASLQLLRAALVVRGRALVIYEEVHPLELYGSAKVHRRFLAALATLMPAQCAPIIVTDAGFRGAWFKQVETAGFRWMGRVRNRDLVRPAITSDWIPGKSLYAGANKRPKDLGHYDYVRSNPIACRFVVVKKVGKGRHQTTVHGAPARSRHAKKQQASQTEPWLIAVSPSLAALSAAQVVTMYSGRMQIEQSFRDLKNIRWGIGLTASQTRKTARVAILLLIGALTMYALWLIGLAIRAQGYCVQFGSKKKAATALSIISLARWWQEDLSSSIKLTQRRIHLAFQELITVAQHAQI